jgi:hypothetical protein
MGRDNHVDGLFVKLAQRDIRSAAYKALGAWSRNAVVELDMTYWETLRENPIVLTQRWLADRLGIDPKTAAHVIDDLETHKFLELERIGKLTGPLGDRGALYRLTWLPTSDGAKATFDNRWWQPSIPASNAARLGASARDIRRAERGKKGLERTNFRPVLEPSNELLVKLQSMTASKKKANSR